LARLTTGQSIQIAPLIEHFGTCPVCGALVRHA
jgi:hypothetical protein